MQQLLNHISPETAYLIQRFPINYGQYSSARYWVETKSNYGQKLFMQTMDRATNIWFKPKANGYVDIIILNVDDDPASWNFGFVIPEPITLSVLSVDNILSLASYYVFSQYQRERILRALIERNCDIQPHFKDHHLVHEPVLAKNKSQLKAAAQEQSNKDKQKRAIYKIVRGENKFCSPDETKAGDAAGMLVYGVIFDESKLAPSVIEGYNRNQQFWDNMFDIPYLRDEMCWNDAALVRLQAAIDSTSSSKHAPGTSTNSSTPKPVAEQLDENGLTPAEAAFYKDLNS